jgi:hypothetical protein
MSHPSNNITQETLKDVVYWHQCSPTQVQRLETIARQCECFLSIVLDICPDCRDRSIAITKIREARMWANSAISLEDAEIDHSRQQNLPTGRK